MGSRSTTTCWQTQMGLPRAPVTPMLLGSPPASLLPVFPPGQGPLCSCIVPLSPGSSWGSKLLCVQCQGDLPSRLLHCLLAQKHLCEYSPARCPQLHTSSWFAMQSHSRDAVCTPAPTPDPCLWVMPGQRGPSADPIATASIPGVSQCNADFNLCGKASLMAAQLSLLT